MSNRGLIFWVGVALVGVVLGLGGATRAASAGNTRAVRRPRTLFAGSRRIYSFALGPHRITWISSTHKRGCEMYVRMLRTGRTLHAPLPSTGCGVPPVYYGAEAPVLADGVAAWVKEHNCGISECSWKIATITGGEAKARVVATVDVGCPPPACGLRHRVGKAASSVPPPFPHPALAGNGNLIVYSTGGATVDRVWWIVGRRHGPFAVPPGLGTTGGIDSLAVGGGAVEVVSTVLDAGDDCGCLYSPAWSPDGSKIAYLNVSPWEAQGAPAVMNADGSARHDLSPTTIANEGPVWSPDGKQVAYGELSPTGPDQEAIWVANADGSGAHQIGLGDNPTWSLDGSKIAFASAGCANATAAMSVMNPDGTNVQQLASFGPGPSCLDYGIAWSPDGTRIAFSLNGTLEVMNADGSNPHPLTPGDEPSWSPDSSQIVFHTDPVISHTDSGLWVIGANGTGLRQLSGGPDDHPSWSSNGQSIVFSSDRNNPNAWVGESVFGSPELYLIDPDGSNLRPLSFTKPSVFENQTTFYSANGTPLPSLPGVPALAGHIAAVGSTNSDGSHEITLFDATTGAQLVAVNVGGNADQFAVAGADSHWVVFHIGNAISALNVNSHEIVPLTTTPRNPLDISVSGHRVAWAENINGHGRIRALDLPN